MDYLGLGKQITDLNTFCNNIGDSFLNDQRSVNEGK